MFLKYIEEILNYFTDVKVKKTVFVKNNCAKKCVSNKYASHTIELKNKNIVYPENKVAKDIEALYAEIREQQAKYREKINKNRFLSYKY